MKRSQGGEGPRWELGIPFFEPCQADNLQKNAQPDLLFLIYVHRREKTNNWREDICKLLEELVGEILPAQERASHLSDEKI